MDRVIIYVSVWMAITTGTAVSNARLRQIFGHHYPNSLFGGHSYGSGFSVGSHTGYYPCVPSQAMCSLTCNDGYMKGPNGCDFCSCNNGIDQTGGGSVVTQGTSQTLLGAGITFHSCVPSQSYCPLKCAGGYSKGPGGCDFCICAPVVHSDVSSTPAILPSKSTTRGAVATQTSQVSTSPSQSSTSGPTATQTAQISASQFTHSHQPQNACTIAKNNCTSTCGSGGYLIDPNDCTVCVCKSLALG